MAPSSQFGTTVDGVEWQFNHDRRRERGAGSDIAAGEVRQRERQQRVAQSGATIDLSGGGDLQAEEFVPGTGGTRDLLSQYNVSFATTSSGRGRAHQYRRH